MRAVRSKSRSTASRSAALTTTILAASVLVASPAFADPIMIKCESSDGSFTRAVYVDSAGNEWRHYYFNGVPSDFETWPCTEDQPDDPQSWYYRCAVSETVITREVETLNHFARTPVRRFEEWRIDRTTGEFTFTRFRLNGPMAVDLQASGRCEPIEVPEAPPPPARRF